MIFARRELLFCIIRPVLSCFFLFSYHHSYIEKLNTFISWHCFIHRNVPNVRLQFRSEQLLHEMTLIRNMVNASMHVEK